MIVAPQEAAVSTPPTFVAFGAKRRRFGKRRSLGLIFLVAVLLAALIDWFSATATRLYLDEDSTGSQQQGTAWQHFAIRGHEVVPEIITDDEARFTIPISLSARQILRFTAHPQGHAAYEILLATGTTSRQLAARQIDRQEARRISLPAGNGELKFVVHGRIVWLDLRLVRQFQWPVYLVLFVFILFAFRIRHPASRLSHRTGNWVALFGSALLSLGIIECVLRFFALKLPPALLTARHDLGLAAPDPRWIESPRYKQRLRPNIETFCEWEYGDIVRMGFLPRDLFGGEHHRYPFQTDAEGFRNPAVRAQIDVAVLGDSFVDAMTSPREEAWPARLEEITGKRVQNYGTSSYGPQQELYVLQDFAIAHQPRDVVLAYFAGNDLFDAERFDNWQRGGDKPGEEPTGWRLKKKFRRFEMLYLTTLVGRAFPARPPAKSQNPARTTAFGFDRGAYQIPAPAGPLLRFALMPPYLQKLAGPRSEIERSRGWQLVRDSISRMKEVCRQHNSRLTVMFVPSKDEVYWPLIARSLGENELQRSVDFISAYNHMAIRVADIRANRLVQNDLMREFCATAGIRFLDLTPILEQAAASGRAVYFADDAHWNAAGHEIAAQELARFLAQQL
jgi:lysophospholipase L1-like esterase